jgi:HK97 gp10 family phage protein
MDTVTYKIEGWEELKAKLERLEAAARGPALEAAARAGAEVIRAEANRRAPGPHVELETTTVTAAEVEVAIGPDRGHWYYQFFELGAGRHTIGPKSKKAIKFPGAEGQEAIRFGVTHPGMTARPFLRPALDGQKGSAVEAVGEELRRRVEVVGNR